MKLVIKTALSLVFIGWITGPSIAEPMAARCTSILGISSGEGDLVYYQAEADLGTDTANSLWAAYHRLKNKCSKNPSGNIVVNVEPRVRQFLEAHL
jgi:hypothetical protein